MKSKSLAFLVLLASSALCAHSETNNRAIPNDLPWWAAPRHSGTNHASPATEFRPKRREQTPKDRLQALAFTTPAYREEATRLLIEEANRVAAELHLSESLPITRSNLVSTYISPPRLAQFRQAIGNITTSNYIYFVSVGCKFSFLERTDLDHERDKLQAQYLWPTNRLDTDAAYQLSTQFLAAASMDVSALTRDCTTRILPLVPEGADKQHFVPVYSVWWERKGTQGRGSVAEVEVCEPTKSLIQLHVSKPEYILRKPLVVQNVDRLLSDTNASPR